MWNKIKNLNSSHLSLRRFNSTQSLNASKFSYYHHVGKNPLVYRTIGQQLRLTTEKYPNNEALVSCHEDKRFTFSDILEKVDRLAAGFHHIGLQKGDRIGIWAPNNSHYYLSVLAAARAGLISVGINPAYQIPEMEYCMQKVGIKAIVAPEVYKTQKYYEMLTRIIPELGSTTNCRDVKSHKIPTLSTVIIDSQHNLPGVLKYDDIFNLPNSSEIHNIEAMQNEIQPDSGYNLQFTSGTTGQPKAALLSHYTFVNNGMHIGIRNELDQKNHRICVQVPLFHAYGAVIGITAALCYGTTLVLPSAGFDPEASIKAIRNEKCSIIYGTPTMYVDLISKLKSHHEKLGNLEIATTGGAACSPKLFMDIKETLGVKKVKTVFGMTETTAVIFQSLLDETKEHVLETVGHVTDHMEAKVIDSNGDIVQMGQSGELCVRGYCTMLGYWGDEKKTKEMISNDKWLKTGDQFVLREDGYGKIVGRIKEMIIRGGENLFPKEIEDFLNHHPKILETHCIGIPDERMGEEVCAFVRLKNPKDSLTVNEVKEFCRGQLAHFKIPRYLEIVDGFPKTVSGKIQKYKLLQIYNKHHKV